MTIYQKSNALCLQVIDFSETSQVARLFTREHGLIAVIAKGIKRSKQAAASPFSGPLDMLAFGQVVFTAARGGGELSTLSGWEVIDHYKTIRYDLQAFYAGAILAEVTLAMLTILDPHPELFDEMVAAISMLGGVEQPRAVTAYIKAALTEAGYLPLLVECLSCGATIGAGNVTFVPRAGGVACKDCSTTGYSITVAARVVLALSRLPKPTVIKQTPPSRQADRGALFQAMQLLTSQIEALIDRPLKTRILTEAICKVPVGSFGEEPERSLVVAGPPESFQDQSGL